MSFDIKRYEIVMISHFSDIKHDLNVICVTS